MTFEGFPFVMGWELTTACNLRCRHCGSTAGLSRENELTLKESLQICNQLPELLVQEVNFTGGEPLIREDWPQIAEHLHDLDIAAKIITNGLLLNQETINIMRDLRIKGVGISLDGLKDTHDYIRGYKGSYDQVINSIRQILDSEIPLTVITTVNMLNLEELPQILILLEKLGVKRWQVQPIFPLGRTKDNNPLKLTKNAYLWFGRFIRDEYKSEYTNLEIGPSDSFGYYTELDPRNPSWGGCPAGISSCGITSDGKIKGCLSLPDELIEGNLRKQDLWDIWFHPDSFSYTRQFSKEKTGFNCQSCDRIQECQGGCSAMSYAHTGVFHNDPYCFYSHNKII